MSAILVLDTPLDSSGAFVFDLEAWEIIVLLAILLVPLQMAVNQIVLDLKAANAWNPTTREALITLLRVLLGIPTPDARFSRTPTPLHPLLRKFRSSFAALQK